MAPEARVHLNHSMLPPGGLPYEEILKKQASVDHLQLPELPQPKGMSALNQYPHGGLSYQALSQINRGYPYKSPMDANNSAMI
jgi:hypothetical protein